MNRWLKRALIALGILAALPIVLAALVLAVANTGPGQSFLAAQIASLSGNTVTLDGLSGRFPDALRIRRIELRDAQGPYATIDDAALDWSPSALLHGTASVQSLTARHIDFARLPAPSPQPAKPATPSDAPFSLPVRADIAAIHVATVTLQPPAFGGPATLSLDGSAAGRSLTDAQAKITAHRTDQPATYDIDATLTPDRIAATIALREPPHGLAATAATLPDLGAIALDATVAGPRDALATKLALAAGDLRATATGTVDLTHAAADLAIAATAPAMRPRPDIGWQSVAIDARIHGPFARPDATGIIRVDGIEGAGVAVQRIAADIAGNAGAVSLKAQIDGLRLPGPKPDLFETAPITLAAAIQLDKPDRPVTFQLDHALIAAKGDASLGDDVTARVTVTSPDLAPFAQAGGVDLQGRTDLTASARMHTDTTTVTAHGTVAITGGQAPVPGLLGDAAVIDAAATVHGSDIAIDHLTLDGKTITLGIAGGLQSNTIGVDWSLALSDLAVLTPSVTGHLAGKGRVTGPQDNFAATAAITGEVASKAVRSGPIHADIAASGLPSQPAGTVKLGGALDNAPIDLAVAATRAAGALHVAIDALSWKSLAGSGALDLPPGQTVPLGHVALKLARLSDLTPLAGIPLTGALDADLRSDANRATIKLTATGAGLPGQATVARAMLDAAVADPLAHPSLDAHLTADGIAASGIGGDAKLDVKGPPEALALRLAATGTNVGGADATLSTAATLDTKASTLALASLAATWKSETARLLAPARIGYGNGVTVDRLRLGLRDAVLDIAGRATPTLDLTASLRNVTADLAAIAAPDLKADGKLSVDARLTGTPQRPAGTVRIDAAGLHLRTGPAATLPPASLTATAALSGDTARIDTRLEAGPRLNATVNGTAPLAPAGTLGLHAAGRVDLALLDPILGAQGQRARGVATLDATVAGTTAAPRVAGSLRLANGEVQDFVHGAHITDIAALIQGDGDTVRIASFTGKAGPGTIGLTGSVGLGGGQPIDLAFTARDARPLSGDQLTLDMNADLTVRGRLAEQLAAAGKVAITHAEIRVPEKLPTSVAVLKIRNPPPKQSLGPRRKEAVKASEAAAPPAPSGGPRIDLDIGVTAREVFVRGRGLDAELGGDLHVGGTAAAPIPSGAFTMRHGVLSVAGQTLTFSKGEVGFNGGDLSDPAIDFVATTVNGGVTANLEIAGSASQPKITFSSTPDLPQDEVLAHLLFGRSASSLSALELAQIAAALAQLTGVGGGGSDPLNAIRSGLGLDRLSVGGDSSGNPSLEAGSYVAPGVFIGAKQGASAGSSQAEVQVDLWKGLKAQATAGVGGGSATGSGTTGTTSTGGSSVGLTYQFEY